MKTRCMDGWLRGEDLSIIYDVVMLTRFVRAALDDERVRSEYERGYKALLDFFHEHL